MNFVHDQHSPFVNHASMLTQLRSLYHVQVRHMIDIRRSSIMQAC